jgi:plasmid maintenance system antidote protein VapI
MLHKGITSNALAKEIGIHPSYLCEILKGTRKGIAQKPRIAEILGMNINSLDKEVI